MFLEVSPSLSRTRTVLARDAPSNGAVECTVSAARATGSERRSRNMESDLDNREVIYKKDRGGKRWIRINERGAGMQQLKRASTIKKTPIMRNRIAKQRLHVTVAFHGTHRTLSARGGEATSRSLVEVSSKTIHFNQTH